MTDTAKPRREKGTGTPCLAENRFQLEVCVMCRNALQEDDE